MRAAGLGLALVGLAVIVWGLTLAVPPVPAGGAYTTPPATPLRPAR
jgi:hypothetical protein